MPQFEQAKANQLSHNIYISLLSILHIPFFS